MLELGKIALTGAISSGKSLALSFFKDFGAEVVSADEIVHKVLIPETELGQMVIDLLGKEIVTGNRIDRAKVADRVFVDKRFLTALEDLLHPVVYGEIEKEYKRALARGKKTVFVAEVPLLFESGGERHFDKTMVVISEKKQRLRRFCRDGGSRREFERRSSYQLRPEESVKRADFVLYNDGTREELRKNVQILFETISREQNAGDGKKR